MFIEHINEFVLPYVISAAEFMGIFVVCYSILHAFWEYLADTFFHKAYDLQFDLAEGLAMALEFKMAAEILKTVMVRQMSELLVLGAIIVLRALLSFLIHFELKTSGHDKAARAELKQTSGKPGKN
jgi:uncharacterized membrane protein